MLVQKPRGVDRGRGGHGLAALGKAPEFDFAGIAAVEADDAQIGVGAVHVVEGDVHPRRAVPPGWRRDDVERLRVGEVRRVRALEETAGHARGGGAAAAHVAHARHEAGGREGDARPCAADLVGGGRRIEEGSRIAIEDALLDVAIVVPGTLGSEYDELPRRVGDGGLVQADISLPCRDGGENRTADRKGHNPKVSSNSHVNCIISYFRPSVK